MAIAADQRRYRAVRYRQNGKEGVRSSRCPDQALMEAGKAEVHREQQMVLGRPSSPSSTATCFVGRTNPSSWSTTSAWKTARACPHSARPQREEDYVTRRKEGLRSIAGPRGRVL